MTKIQLYIYIYNLYRVLLVLLILELKGLLANLLIRIPLTHITGWVMKHFQYSVMGHGILLRSLGWTTKISGGI